MEVDDPALAVVAGSFAVGEADSAALARAGDWVPERPAVLRHHLLLPAERVPEAATLLAQDGWDLREVSHEAGRVRLHALRVQRLDALACARERARMAGLAQRLGGDAEGWDALQPPG
nr:ribonuclease E inhibitor RraB [Qaidamihabitans albus]